MKRTAFVLVGLGILGSALYLGSRLWAQAPPATPTATTQPAPLRTRVAVVNFIKVIKDYKKAQAFQDNINRQTEQFDKSMEPTRNKLIELRNALQKPDLAVADRDAKEREMKKLQREYQERAEDFQKVVIKQGDDGLVSLFKEVQEAVEVFAKSNDIELVLQYSDPTTPADYYSPVNIKRKVQGGPLMPIYITRGMDISEQVVYMLNARYTAATGWIHFHGSQELIGMTMPGRLIGGRPGLHLREGMHCPW